jgi:hypothetical protein
MNIKRSIIIIITTTTTGLALAAGLAGRLASAASASTTPKYCTSSFFQKCATIKITGSASTRPPATTRLRPPPAASREPFLCPLHTAWPNKRGAAEGK